MTKVNAFIEDTLESDLIDKKKILTLVKKMFKELMQIESIQAHSALRGYEYKSISFDIVLVDDKKIQEINAEYRGIDRPTDVITFSLFADCEKKFIIDNDIALGEILISLDTAQKQAKTTLQNEVATLILHGILHLLGFDHLNDIDYNFIVKVQNQVLQSVKIPI